MKILEVSLGVGDGSGGPVRSITGLTRALSAIEGCEVWYFVHNPKGIDRFDLGKTHIERGHWDETTHRDGTDDFVHLLKEVRPDVVHFHGIWHLILHDDQRACRKYGIPYIIAPRGSLDAWSMKQKARKKQLAMLLFQRRDLLKSLALHVTAKMEEDYCRALGLNHRFLISPNGVNLPLVLPTRRRQNGSRIALFVSRMHPKKGVIELIHAWAIARPQGWVCELVYTLNGEEEYVYEERVRREVVAHGLSDVFVFTGALDDVRKWDAYCRADFLVLPTHTENFGIVVAEALYAGIPVLTTKNAPWQGLERNRCGWWIDLEERQLVVALKEATSLSDTEREAMGMRGREYVLASYSWPAIAKKFVTDCQVLLEKCQ